MSCTRAERRLDVVGTPYFPAFLLPVSGFRRPTQLPRVAAQPRDGQVPKVLGTHKENTATPPWSEMVENTGHRWRRFASYFPCGVFRVFFHSCSIAGPFSCFSFHHLVYFKSVFRCVICPLAAIIITTAISCLFFFFWKGTNPGQHWFNGHGVSFCFLIIIHHQQTLGEKGDRRTQHTLSQTHMEGNGWVWDRLSAAWWHGEFFLFFFLLFFWHLFGYFIMIMGIYGSISWSISRCFLLFSFFFFLFLLEYGLGWWWNGVLWWKWKWYELEEGDELTWWGWFVLAYMRGSHQGLYFLSCTLTQLLSSHGDEGSHR